MKNTNKSSNKGRGIKAMLIVLGILLAFVLVFVGILFSWSPGKIENYLDENGKELKGSISEKIFVEINGVKQGMIIKGKNTDNPVLLFLHGGPGMPTYFLTEKYPTGFEDSFTVCYWEQRGGGISYNADFTSESITVEQLISDAVEVTNYLRERFGQEKIYLMAHSWGSFIGIQTAAKVPELYHAYIGVSQISNQIESEKIAYKYMINEYTARGDTRTLEKLKDSAVLESDAAVMPFFKSPLRDKTMHELGIGTMHGMKSVINDVFWPVMQCRAYTLREKINVWRAKPFLVNKTILVNQLFSTDLPLKVPSLEIPVYFLSGIYDYTVNHDLSKAFLNQLQAPVKGFYTFEQSSHCPMHEEPAKFMKIIREDVLKGTTALADK